MKNGRRKKKWVERLKEACEGGMDVESEEVGEQVVKEEEEESKRLGGKE